MGIIRKHPILTAFVALYMLVCSGAVLAAGNSEFILYSVVMGVLIGLVLAMHARVGFSTGVLWLLAVWGMLHMAGGTIHIPPAIAQSDRAFPVLYALRPVSWLPRYDQATHAFGFFSATLAGAEALRAATRFERATPGFALACFCVGVGLGAVNEVIEFGVTLVVPDHNVGGYENTGWDLVSNSVGAALGALLTLRARPRVATGE